jgi:HlyD family secretion protein
VTVAAYPNRRFQGTVLKIEPQAVIEQNVTMFPVLVSIDNPEGLLRPGMNCDVEFQVGRREGVLAIPNAALRTPQDVDSAGGVLGLSETEIREQLDGAPSEAGVDGRYLVFVLQEGRPRVTRVRTGLTDLDYSEVLEGLSESDRVLLLPSAGLVRSQQSRRERINRITGGGLPGVRSTRP